MGLTQYRKKRSFSKTPEPTGGKSTKNSLLFVIQKHAATRLHYDFRLEMDGVLKSWAVPKGPSLNPRDKRLAMMVEDHPYDYRDFEGIIPKGQYGGGTVIVWDTGTFEPLDPSGDKQKDEKNLLKQLKAGSLKFRLNGSKVKGEFALVKLKNADEDNAWLLIKHNDRYARQTDITLKDKSVISKKTLEQIAANPPRVYGRKTIEPGTTEKDQPVSTKRVGAKPAAKKTVAKKTLPDPAQNPLLKELKKMPFPKTVSPMLASLAGKAFDAEGWLYEIKWDGYRALALLNKGNVQLVSRNNKSFNEKFYPVYDAVSSWNINAVVDGEICVLNNKGIAHFGSLQNWRSEADGELVYYVFDILWLSGKSTMELPLEQRKQILKDLIPDNSVIRYSESFDTSAAEFLNAASKMGMEGIMAKRKESIYMPGERTRDWLKIKANKRHEVVIGGFTNNEDSPKPFSSLLVGVYAKGKLVYTGKIGTGFNQQTQKDMLKQFRPLVTKTCPFTEIPDVNKPSRFRHNPPHATATWLKPQLVCEVSYTEITDDGVMRHPSFEGMRTDKAAKSVKAEVAVEVETTLTAKEKKATRRLIRPVTKERKTLLNPTEKTQVKTVKGHELTFTNLNKIYWPDVKVTKREMLNYYYQVAPYIMPYLINRPQSLNRYPNGISGHSFYQKDITGKAPEWVKQMPYRTSTGEDKNFLVPQDESDLLYMANLGAIEMNPWNSTVDNPDNPDWCMIDLDPDKGNSFEQVITTAQTVKEVLDELGVTAYPKTSGSTGIHIYIPLGAKYDYDQSQLFGRIIATNVHRRLPGFTSIERLTANRKGKVYVDFLQNRPKATLAAPYSLRPKPGATVSMPLHWEEVRKGLKMKDFTIKNAVDRIRSEGDLFRPVLGKGVNLQKLVNQLSEMEA
ncbi:DNA ligase D [Sediminibacterium ginsengisoli]|uniref:DNA ligase (ATP) n=1 Tax=Sediminibacterium ginsengisoli TaxID=413434 RepID=A0A1T4P860_9BACT|nr:DNA ligase D [Sediminibacterium ginsengisoli]SJZ87775.1 bifunctional non-homologous end joining protein LigD [Sediminibacterium ginsengisoli]